MGGSGETPERRLFTLADILLDPRRTWDDPEAYDAQAAKLVQMFTSNFAQYEPHVGEEVRAAAPGVA